MRINVDNFCHKLLHVHDIAPTEVLDHFLHGLQPSMRAQVLIACASIFACAAILAKHIAGAHGKAACNGPQLIDLGSVQGSSMGVTYYGVRQGNCTRTEQGHSGQRKQGG